MGQTEGAQRVRARAAAGHGRPSPAQPRPSLSWRHVDEEYEASAKPEHRFLNRYTCVGQDAWDVLQRACAGDRLVGTLSFGFCPQGPTWVCFFPP